MPHVIINMSLTCLPRIETLKNQCPNKYAIYVCGHMSLIDYYVCYQPLDILCVFIANQLETRQKTSRQNFDK